MECGRYGQSTGELSLWSFLCWSGTQNRTLRSRLWASARYFPRRNEKCVKLLDAWPGSHEQWRCPRQRETRILGESGARPILAKVPKHPLVFHCFFFIFWSCVDYTVFFMFCFGVILNHIKFWKILSDPVFLHKDSINSGSCPQLPQLLWGRISSWLLI